MNRCIIFIIPEVGVFIYDAWFGWVGCVAVFDAVVTDGGVKIEIIVKPTVGTCPYCKRVGLEVICVTWCRVRYVWGCGWRGTYVCCCR